VDFQDEKRRLFHTMIEEGNGPLNLANTDVLCAKAGVHIPNELKEKWMKQLERVKLPESPENMRTLNHFFIGADPEFVMTGANNKYYSAQDFGLDTQRAFGADMSGRQAEIRAYPSRSCVEVVASILETLRWMNVFVANGDFLWKAPAYYGHDGIGGHIHFGRKRPYRAHEIKNLDLAVNLLLSAGVLDAEGQGCRRTNTEYGRASDYRLQPHGYEYRTMPTWLCSPEVAHLTLTIAKLTLLHKPQFRFKVSAAQSQILALLATYKAFDDDAAIAYNFIQRWGMPSYVAKDFKAQWGIAPSMLCDRKYAQAPQKYFIPEVIKPHQYTVETMFNYLTRLLPIATVDARNVTWDLFQLPRGVHNVQVQQHVTGLAEIGSGLVSKGVKAQVNYGTYDGSLRIETPIPLDKSLIQKELQRRVPSFEGGLNYTYSSEFGTLVFQFPAVIFEGHVPSKKFCYGFRELISDPTLFPVCKGNKFNSVKWPESYGVEEKPIKLIGKRVI
jgi:hypothetical protein